MHHLHIKPPNIEFKYEQQIPRVQSLQVNQKMEENPAAKQAATDSSLSLALATAVVESSSSRPPQKQLRSKRRPQKQQQQLLPPSTATATAAAAAWSSGLQAFCGNSNSESDATKWKRKAKQRKEEILRLQEDLKIAEDGLHHDVFPQNVSCKCYFYDDLGQLGPKHESGERRFSDVLLRRFLRQVRLSERKRRRRDGSLTQSYISVADGATGNKMEQLRASVDFLVELCETSSPLKVEEGNFKNWSHQAIDFILDILKDLSAGGGIDETIESIVSSLIMRLMRRMCNGSQGDEFVNGHNNFQFYVQHWMRKLGSDPYIGQRVILSVSQRISIVAESLFFMDPFDGAFSKMHNCMYVMIQLIEFLVSDYLLSWSTRKDFDTNLLEEWVISVFHARKSLELLESSNTLYVLYMERVVGELTRHLGQAPFLQMLRPDALDKLFG